MTTCDDEGAVRRGGRRCLLRDELFIFRSALRWYYAHSTNVFVSEDTSQSQGHIYWDRWLIRERCRPMTLGPRVSRSAVPRIEQDVLATMVTSGQGVDA